MASQNRTITLTLNAQTNGADSVRDLANEIGKLGKKGGDAAPEFEKLSQELNDLAARQDAVATFTDLTAAVTQSKTALDAAKVATNAEASALATLKQTLTQATTAEQAQAALVQKATAERQAANQSYREAKANLDAFTASIGGAKRVTDETRPAYNALTQAVRNAKAEYSATIVAVGRLTPEYEKLQAAASKVAEEVKVQERALAGTSKVTDAASEKYDELTNALGAASVALKKLGIDDKDVTTAQNALAQSMTRLTSEADRLKNSLASSGNTAQTAAQKINSAFSGTGVQTASKLTAEILKIDQALLKLARDTSINETEFNSAFTAGKARIAELEAEMRKAEGTTKRFGSGFANAMKQFGPATLVFNGITAAINGLLSAGQKIPQVTAEFQTMERTLRILTGSAAQAQKEIGYIGTVANRVGGDVIGLSNGYIKLTAATKGTNLEGAQTRRTFEAVAGAMGTLGVSASETQNAIQAVTQAISKGTLSMEEFRQQLSERIPGLLQGTAEALGITTTELNELIASGKLASEDAIPAINTSLEKLYKTSEKNETLIGQWYRFTNALKQSGNAIGESGIVEGLLKAGQVGSAAAVGIAEDFVLAGRAIGAFAAATVTGDFKGAMDGIKEEFDAVNKRLMAIAGFTGPAGESIELLAKKAQAAGQEFFVMADGTKIATKSVIGAGNEFVQFSVKSQKAQDSAENFATAARKVAEYTRSAGEAAITAANAIGSEADQRKVATQVADDNARALAVLATEEAKVLKILEDRALRMAIDIRDGKLQSQAHKDSLIQLGEEISKRKIVVQGIGQQTESNRLLAASLAVAAEANQNNAGRVDSLRTAYVELERVIGFVKKGVDEGKVSQEQLTAVENEARKVKKLYVDALNDEAFATEAIARISGNEKQQRDAAILSTERHLQMLRDVGEARTDEYRKTELQLAQLQLERAALNDNSGALLQLRTEYENTSAKVNELREAKAAGKDVTEALSVAELAAAKAAVMYSDALKDQKEKIEAVKNAKIAELDVKSAGVRVAIAEIQSYAEVAKAMGDEEGAAAALTEVKRLEIELARLTAQAKKLEAEAAKQVALAKIEEIKATGIMTDAKKAEIAALEASVKVKEAEANIAGITADKLAALAAVTENAGASADNAAGGYDTLADSMRNAADAAGELGQAGDGVRTATLSPTGQRTSGAVDFTQTFYKRGATIEEQKLAQKYVGELYRRNQATMLAGNLGNEQNAARLQKQAINDAVDRALIAARQEMRSGQAVNLGPSVNDIMTRNLTKTDLRSQDDMIRRIQLAGNEAKGNYSTVNITLGQKTTSVNVASQDDAAALTSVFKLLEQDSTRAF